MTTNLDMLAAAAVARQQRELLGYDTDAAGIIEYTALLDWYGTQRAPSMQQWLDSGGTKAEEISLLSDSDDELVGGCYCPDGSTGTPTPEGCYCGMSPPKPNPNPLIPPSHNPDAGIPPICGTDPTDYRCKAWEKRTGNCIPCIAPSQACIQGALNKFKQELSSQRQSLQGQQKSQMAQTEESIYDRDYGSMSGDAINPYG